MSVALQVVVQLLHMRAMQAQGSRLRAAMKQGKPSMAPGRGRQPGEGESEHRQAVQGFGKVRRQLDPCRDQPMAGQLPDLLQQTFIQTLDDDFEAVMMLRDLQR